MSKKSPRFIQIHSLHNYSGVLLNRDETGLAKRLPYGGTTRTRISSQCLKRHWRMNDGEYSLVKIPDVEGSVRSRELITQRVIGSLRAEGFDPKVLESIEPHFQKAVYGKKGDQVKSRQPLLFGNPELEYLEELIRGIISDSERKVREKQPKGKNAQPEEVDIRAEADRLAKEFCTESKAESEFQKMMKVFRGNATLPAGLIAALFGRMVTADPAANIEAPIHVAHSFTVHSENSESDYFSAVDDLKEEDDGSGAGHIGDVELTSGIFYGYTVLDIPGLVSNTAACPANQWLDEGADRELASRVTERLIKLIATVSPGAKRGSTAPYSYAELLLVEIGEAQPRSLAAAFREACAPDLPSAIKNLSKHLLKLDSRYDTRESRMAMSLDDSQVLSNAKSGSLNEIASWAANCVENGIIDK